MTILPTAAIRRACAKARTPVRTLSIHNASLNVGHAISNAVEMANVSKEVQTRWLDDVPGNLRQAELNWPRLKDLAPKGW